MNDGQVSPFIQGLYDILEDGKQGTKPGMAWTTCGRSFVILQASFRESLYVTAPCHPIPLAAAFHAKSLA